MEEINEPKSDIKSMVTQFRTTLYLYEQTGRARGYLSFGLDTIQTLKKLGVQNRALYKLEILDEKQIMLTKLD